jgi:hypothetical protein
VSWTRFFANLSVRNDWLLRRLFARAARGLPLARLPEVRRPQPARADLERVEFENRAIDEFAAVHGAEPVRRRSYGSSGT